MKTRFISFISFTLLCSLFYSVELHAQQPMGVIDVSGRIINKGEAASQDLDDLNLFVVDYGTVPLKDGGYFQFKAPKGLDIKIEILPTDYRIMRPLDGILLGETKNYDIEIYVMTGSNDSTFQNQISALDDEIRNLQAEKALTAGQIRKLDRIILDTVFYFQNQQQRFQNQIAQLNSRLSSANTSNQQLRDTIRQFQMQMNILEDSVSSLINQLVVALEEKYLRQKSHYDEFSSLLLDYQSKAKDLRDWMPKLEDCFRHPDALSNFNKVCVNYGKARDALHIQHEAQLAAVQHYWEAPQAFTQASAVCNLIFDEIHDSTILPGVNDQVMPHLKNYASRGVRKVKEVKKIGKQMQYDLFPLLENLDQEMEALFVMLAEEL